MPPAKTLSIGLNGRLTPFFNDRFEILIIKGKTQRDIIVKYMIIL